MFSPGARRSPLLTLLATLSFAVCVTGASSGHAQWSSESDRGTWYGWQNLSIDAAGLALIGTALVLKDNDVENTDSMVALLGGVVLAFGSPIVHWVHRNPEYGFISLGLRGTILLLLAIRVASGLGCIDYEGEGTCGDDGGLAVGLAITTGIATVIIDMVLAHERPARTQSRRGLRPALAVRTHSAWLGLRADF
jgi:hypothetical protein